MHFRRTNLLLIGIMVSIAIAILLSTLTVLYQTAYDLTRQNLARTAISQVRMLEAMATIDAANSSRFPDGPTATAISQMRDAFQSLERIGDTGEFVLGRREGGQIIFLLITPGKGDTVPDAVPIEAEFAEPMRLALTGQAGIIVAPDYVGTPVLAAYQPVTALDLGIVVKIDIAEIRAPFIRAGGYLVLFSVALTMLGSFLFFRVSNPLIRRLEESERRYARAISGTNDGLWERNFQTGELYFSPRWAEILGYQKNELEPRLETFENLLHPDDRALVKTRTNAHLENAAPYDIEFRLRTKSNDYLWVQSRGRATFDSQGQPLIMAGSITDISERKQFEAALKESEERFRTVFETIETGIMVIDAEGTVQIFNPAAEEMFGYAADEAIGQNIAILMPDPDRALHDTYLQNYARTGEAKVICIGRQVTGLRKNGETFPMQLEVGEMDIAGESWFVGSVADLTEFQSLENQLRQSQKLEAIGQLTGGVAHDFNNLLAVIQGNLSLLVEDLTSGNEDPEDKPIDLIMPALAASKRGADLTQRLLAFSRKQALQPRTVNLNELARGMEDMLRRTLGEGVNFGVSPQQGKWMVLADPSQLENALLNLALNARDAMPNGGKLTIETKDVRLDNAFVSLHPDVSTGDYVMLAVSDTGTGMTAAVREKAFDPFFTTKGTGKGSGLGLSMVHGFVKQSGGVIEIHSEPGEGTSVKLYLPRSLEQEEEAADTPDAALFEGGNETILVVEDEEEVRRMTVRVLARLGYRVLEASDGKTALSQLADDGQIDLLLADVVLTGDLNGRQIADAAIELDPGLKVLFMSGYTEDALTHQGRMAAGTKLIGKPFSTNDLAAKVREVLDGTG